MRLFILFLFLTIIGSVSLCFSSTGNRFSLTVSGLTDEMKNNVLAHLSLASQLENQELSDMEYNRLYSKIPDETRTALQPFGYYHPKIELSRDTGNAANHIRINVTPGPPVLVKEVEITLRSNGRDDAGIVRVKNTFPLRPGDIFDHRKYETGKRELFAAALEGGYQNAAFTVNRVQVYTQSNQAHINLELDTGKQFIFGPITYTSVNLSNDLLRKLSPVAEGDPFSPKALTKLRQSLLDSGYFSNVKLVYNLEKTQGQSVPVRVELQPAKSSKYRIGAGYGTDTGFRGTAGWSDRHLNQHGHQLDITLQPSERKSSFSGAYTIPISNPKKERIALLGKWENENFDNTETKTWSSTLGYDLIRESGETSVYLKYLDEDYTAGTDQGHAILLTPGVQSIWRFADDRIDTTKGIRIALDITGGSDGLLSDTSFLQGSLHSKGILSPSKNWRLIGRFEAGGTIVDDIYDLPPSLRFYAGGDQSVRGYGYKRIGPMDSAGNVIGGRYLLTYSLEIERLLYGSWGAALFFDSGSAMNSLSDFTMQHGAGIGIRWKAPFGQIRLDIAKGLSDEGDPWRLHFNIGADL